MNSVVLGTGGYALLLSSFPILIALVKRHSNHTTSTPFYTMAMFDLFYSILTAILLLINHVRIIMNNDSVRNNINVGNTSMGISTEPRELCNETDILMEYAMLLIPLVNTFVSLFATSVQCNLRVLCLRDQCTAAIQAEDIAESDTSSGLNETQGKALETNVVLRFFKSRAPTLNSTKILSIFVLVIQYFLPIIVTGSLYAVPNEYTNATDYGEDTGCMLCTSFPFKDYCQDTELRNTTINSFYIKTEDALKVPNSNNSQMEEILSKVQGIVLSTLNESESKFTPGFYNKSGLLDVTKFMEKGSTIPALNVDEHSSTYTQEIVENIKDSYETISMPSVVDFAHETLDFEVPKETTQSDLQEIPAMSHDDIYKDIITRIHGAGGLHSTKKQQQKLNNRHEKKSDETNTRVLYDPDILKQIENNLYKLNTYASTHKCVLSPRYLKLYVFLVLLLIYCLPIALASTMQMWGRLSCKFLEEKMRTKQKSMTTSLKNKPVAGFCFIDDSSSNDSVVVQSAEDHFSRAMREPSIADSVEIRQGRCSEIMKETNNAAKTLDITKTSLALAAVLWCPIIVQTALKLFLCVHSPSWLMQATYLLALGFCIVRNILNMRIVRLQEANEQARKRNSIRPSE